MLVNVPKHEQVPVKAVIVTVGLIASQDIIAGTANEHVAADTPDNDIVTIAASERAVRAIVDDNLAIGCKDIVFELANLVRSTTRKISVA